MFILWYNATVCGGEFVGELFWIEIIGGSLWYISYSIKDDYYNCYCNHKFLWTKILLV